MATRIGIPPEISALGLLPRVDYADAFTVDADADLGPEEAVRRALERAPAPLVPLVRCAMRAVGLRLHDVDETHPLGWRVCDAGPEVFVLGSDGGSTTARLLVTRADGRAVLVTQLAFEDPRRRLLWERVVAPVHRRVARYLMDAARR